MTNGNIYYSVDSVNGKGKLTKKKSFGKVPKIRKRNLK